MFDTETKRINDLSKEAVKIGFDAWKSQPVVRAVISTIPPTENRDMLEALLKSCFETGFNAGVATFMMDIVKTMFKKGMI